MRTSNHLIGFINFLTFILSIPILGGGIWLTTRANTTDCHRFLQWPIIIIGICLMVVSLAGFAGSCYRNNFLMYVYLWSMFIIIVALIGFVIFAYAVTSTGSGRSVINRTYLDYSIEDYSGWLADRVGSQRYWMNIANCIRDSHVCRRIGRSITGVAEPDYYFYLRRLSPIESGCCKPPTSCGFIYVNETVWVQKDGVMGIDLDCIRWSNDQDELCYACNSCKAGVLASLKQSWRIASVINIIVLSILVILYVVAYAAFRHNKNINYDEPYGQARMEKMQLSRMHL